MAPVGVVWERDVHEGGMAVVPKHRRGNDLAARVLPLHAREI